MKSSAFLYAAGFCLAATTASAGDLTIVSWGGAYTKSQTEAYYKPWMASTGHRILSEDYSGGRAEVKAQVQASWISYAPVRKSASELVGSYHADPDLKMGPHLPTWPDNMKTAIWHDEEFWADHIDELNERFNAWLIE